MRCAVCLEDWPIGERLDGSPTNPGDVVVCAGCASVLLIEDGEGRTREAELTDLHRLGTVDLLRLVQTVRVVQEAIAGRRVS